ncbi:MAG: hypothetical protein KDB61_16290, partial [Planctomycetes bacterium]|nr:hypothetical protein [Planctomycetota bacterium]
GSVHFFASLSPFDNDHLRDADHGEALAYLLANSKPGVPTRGLFVVYGGGRSFLALLWQHGWLFLIAFGCLTAAWLWRVSRRFGPVLEDPAWDPEGVGIGGGREFLEHIEAAARTYERRGQKNRLLDAARERVLNMPGGPPEASVEALETTRDVSVPFQQKIKVLEVAARRVTRGSKSTIPSPEKPND